MDFKQKKYFKTLTLRLAVCPLNTGAKDILSMDLPIPTLLLTTMAFKGDNNILNYPNIQFLRKLGEWQCTKKFDRNCNSE